ncbi:ABC-three component system protein, partial [Burkholderia gladioli]|uniref:ABC-three component system protein n=1 Tax=Burkholderia gladioli TaxID=28095 RepID=UPI002FE3B148
RASFANRQILQPKRDRVSGHAGASPRVDMAIRIRLYDQLLVDEWSVKHGAMAEDNETSSEDIKRAAGLEIFKWSYYQASTQVTPFAQNWSANYYVRGSYQVLAIEQTVGWHPDFKTLLAEKP